MTFILMIAVISNNGELLITSSHSNAGHFWFHDNNMSYVSYRSPYDILKPLEEPSCRVPTVNMLLSDSIQTIGLPISPGGILYPGKLLYNPTNEKVYIISQGWLVPNIAVCDAQSGSLSSVIKTDWTTRTFACSETSNKLYCANYNRNTIEVIDCQTNQVIKTVRLPAGATALAWSGASNEIYCTQQENYRVEIIDCMSDIIIDSIHTGGYPKALYYNPISNKVYCANFGNLDIIDANSHTIIQNIPLATGEYFFTFNTINNKIYCINSSKNSVTIIDGIGDTLITTCQLGSGPWCAAYNSVVNRVYVGHFYSEDVYILDGNTNELIDILFFHGPVFTLAYDSTDNRLFVVEALYYDEDCYADMIVFDGTSNAIIDTLETGIPINSAMWESEYNHVWVTNRGAHNLPGYTVNGYAADSLLHRFKTAVGFTPFAAVLNPVTDKYYCVGRSDNYVLIFNTDNPDSCVLKETGECAWDILLNPLENKIYCANYSGRNVSIMDGATDSIIAQVPIGADVLALELNHTDNKVYVSSLLETRGSYIMVIDGHTNAVLDTIPVPDHPFSMLWNSIDNKLYIAGLLEGTITIMDAHADTVLATISTPGDAWSLVHNTMDDKIYCSLGDFVMVIDGATNEIVTTIDGLKIFAFTYNPVNNKVYCGGKGGVCIIDGATDSIAKVFMAQLNRTYSLLYNPITNTIFCAYAYGSDLALPWQDGVMVIDGASDEVLADFLIESQVFWFMYWGGISAPPRGALLLDSLNNIVYLNHYFSSKISVLDGAIGISETDYAKLIPRKPMLRIFPNPSTRDITIEYSLPHANNFQLKIYDVTGRLVKQMDKSINSSPIGQMIWDRKDNFGMKVSNGVYFLTFQAGDYKETKKLILLR